MIQFAHAVTANAKVSSRPRPAKSLSALVMTLLFLSGVTVPAIAQTVQNKDHAINASAAASAPDLFLSPHAKDQFTESAQLEAELEQLVSQVIAEETHAWSPAQKAALQTMDSMALKDSELLELATLSASELHTKMKTSKKLAKLNSAGISSEEALKLAPMMLLSRYLFNIGRAAVWGGVVSAIHSADFDYRALTSALTSGNTSQFMSLLREGLSGQTTFTNLVSSAATFACGSATLDFTPRLCNRFASGMQKIFRRVERSNRPSTVRTSQSTRRTRAFLPAAVTAPAKKD